MIGANHVEAQARETAILDRRLPTRGDPVVSARLLVTFHMDGGVNATDLKIIERGRQFVVLDPGALGGSLEYDDFYDALSDVASRAGWLKKGK